LPSDLNSLSGGEQIVITKLNYNKADCKVFVKTSEEDSTGIAGNYKGIYSDNPNDSFSSIHLRAVPLPTVSGEIQKYTWIPVAATGNWRPYFSTDTTVKEVGNKILVDSTALKLQPYNLDINFSLNGTDITKRFTVEVQASLTDNHQWSIKSPITSEGVGFTDNNIILNHNILNGVNPTNTTVYYVKDNKLIQVIPDEIFTEMGKFGITYVNITSWIEDAIASNIDLLKFEIVVSI
jgi:hypothetical protein